MGRWEWMEFGDRGRMGLAGREGSWGSCRGGREDTVPSAWGWVAGTCRVGSMVAGMRCF